MALPPPKVTPGGGNLFETILSALVVLVAVGFALFFFRQTGTGHLGSYSVKVSMTDASGLSVGSEVRLAGVKVGSVTGVTLLPSYRVIVETQIRDDLVLPVDSRAKVSSSAFGDIYLGLVPGHAKVILPKGGTLGLPPRSAPAKGDQASLTSPQAGWRPNGDGNGRISSGVDRAVGG